MTKVLALFAAMAAVLVACATGPVFDARADHEEGHDRPCYIEGRLQRGWHQCQMEVDEPRCCPDGSSCGGDDFVKRPGVCRWWGTVGDP